MKENIFNIDELNELELLEVKGGTSDDHTLQVYCPNNVAGCACSIKQD